MAARKKAEENCDSCRRVYSYGSHALPYQSYGCEHTRYLGPLQHTWNIDGMALYFVYRQLSLLTALQSSGEDQIKKRYRDLSRTLHPDKAKPDPSKNETLESINDHWVEVSKAFKALTDEEIRNNYIQYGHPDGKQGISIVIAFPKFIVNDGSVKYVLLVYGLLLGVLLPYFVGAYISPQESALGMHITDFQLQGRWWYGTQRMTKEKVLLGSASGLFREYKDDIADGDVVNALTSGLELEEVLSGNRADAGLGKIEQSIQNAVNDFTASGLSGKDQEKVAQYDGVRRKAAALLWSYLGRLKLDATLDDGQFGGRIH